MLRSTAGRRSVWMRGRDWGDRLLAGGVYPRLGYDAALSRIVARNNLGAVMPPSHIRDFGRGFSTPASGIDLAAFTPYYADYPRGTLYFARMDPSHDDSRAFFYMAQREFADRIAAVRMDRIAGMYDAGFVRAAEPLLIFSIGRCGSTLLSSLVRESGVYTFSEPDIFNQTAELGGAVGRRLGHSEARIREDCDRILGVTLQALLARAKRPLICIKLRSGSALIYPAITTAYPGADTVFLFRGLEDWARSWISAFGTGADRMVRTLTHCVEALDFAQETGRPHRVRWYEDIVADPAAACRAILGAAAGPCDLSRAITSDSQHGTGLSAERLGQRRSEDAAGIAEALDAFLRLWRETQPAALLRKHGLTGLAA